MRQTNWSLEQDVIPTKTWSKHKFPFRIDNIIETQNKYIFMMFTNTIPPALKCRGQECVELYLHSPNMPSWRVAQFLKKYRNKFTFTFTNMKSRSILS
jgi:hypothetical protein